MMTETNDANSTASGAPAAVRLDLRKKKKPKKKPTTTTAHSDSQTAETDTFFDATTASSENDKQKQRETVREFDGKAEAASLQAKANLVIPVQTTGRTFGHRPTSQQQQATTSTEDNSNNNEATKNAANNNDDINNKQEKTEEDAEAIQALQNEADAKSGGPRTKHPQQVIASAQDTFQRKPNASTKDEEQRETEQLQSDLNALPEAMDLEEYGKSRVPIAEFGAAMLRGMGWKGDNHSNDKSKTNKNSSKDSEPALPRPHRLGLGATPQVETNNNNNGDGRGGRKRPRTMDQYERDKKLQKQAQDFARQRQQQTEADKQQSLQDGSLVLLKDGTRARMIQIAGVPGLNQVKVQMEGSDETTIVKRGFVDSLVTRLELDKKPFHETRLVNRSDRHEKERGDEEKRRTDEGRDGDSRDRERKQHRRDDRKRSDNKDDRGRRSSGSREQRREEKRDSSPKTWVIPQIKVRIVTEKLGRRYFKEKGVVVDVTSKGSTVELANRVVLDRVPERYMETALPKAGGRVVVLTKEKGREYLYSKGTLLERGRGRGVVQLDSDKSVLELSLDDLAEWMGPMEDE